MSGLRDQLEYLRKRAAAIASGAQQIDGTLRQRARLYAHSARATFWNTRRRVNGALGKLEERNVLSGTEHCAGHGDRPGCLEQTALGWVPLGTLAPIGERSCYGNCRCRLEFR